MKLRVLVIALVLAAIGAAVAIWLPSGAARVPSPPAVAARRAERAAIPQATTPLEPLPETARPSPPPIVATSAPTEPPSVYSAVFERPLPRTPTFPAPTGTRGPMDPEVQKRVRAPVLVKKVEPEYPEAARKARMEGQVVVEAILTDRGELTEIRVARPLNPLLDASAIAAFRQWQYQPATLDGKPVRVYVTATVTFSLH